MNPSLILPGHPAENPPTDDYWPQLTPGLDPVFYPDDGEVAGPYKAKDAKWFFPDSSHPSGTPPESGPLIATPYVGVTDSRVFALGSVGADCPPGRRLITQLRLVCCTSLEWNTATPMRPPVLILAAMTREGEHDATKKVLVLRFPRLTDVRSIAIDLVRRAAIIRLRLGLLDPKSNAAIDLKAVEYLQGLATGSLGHMQGEGHIRFPVFVPLDVGMNYQASGEEGRKPVLYQRVNF